ncbi:hypothetical protein Clacol_008179 [Clathrus columnatus]|uniref:Cytochrome P450 n=1 Tax=Clathrus columnatus TaxID=1419009 RepID=A0AAV5AGZ8_9AGAM|nr:hypothetical protein Clacol_008179 [Clathrus columnatus]
MPPFLIGLFAIIFALLVFILYIFIRPKLSQLHKLQGPPVNGLFTSHLELILNVSASHEQIDKLVKKYGTSFRINGLASVSQLYLRYLCHSQPSTSQHDERLVTVDPTAMTYILNRPWIYQKPWQSRRLITRLIGEGLLGSEGIIHKRLRKLSNPAFSQQNLREFLPTFFKKALELKECWEKIISQNPHHANEIDICHWLGRLTVDIIGETGFDYPFNAIRNETNEVYLAFRDMFAAVFTAAPEWEIILGIYFPFFNKLWRSKTNVIVEHSQRVIQKVGKDVIKRKKDAFEKGVDPGKDLLTLLLKSNYSDETPPEQRVSNEDLFNQVSTFLFAGSDTSSLALTWTLQLLTEHPDIQTRLRQEFHDLQTSKNVIKNVLDIEDDKSYADMYKAIDVLPFLDNVIRESLRLIPPIHSSLRVATRDDYIPFSGPVLLRDGTTQHGIGIKKGQIVHVSIEAFNVNKNVWGEDAWSFNPDRWLNIPDKARQQPGLYPNNMSFSAGPRTLCSKSIQKGISMSIES